MTTRLTKQLPGDLLLSLSAAPGLVLRSIEEKYSFAPIESSAKLAGVTRFQNYDILRLSPDGKRVAAVFSYNSSTSFYIFELDDGGNTFLQSVGGIGAITDVAWSPDNLEVAVASASAPYIYRFDALTLSQLGAFVTAPSVRVNTVSYSNDGKYLFAGVYSTQNGNNDAGFWVYSRQLNDLVSLAGQTMLITGDVAMFPNGRFILALGRASGTQVRVFDALDFSKPAYDLGTSLNNVGTSNKRVSFSADGEYIVICGSSNPFLRVAKINYGAGAYNNISLTAQTLTGETTLTGFESYRMTWLSPRVFAFVDTAGLKKGTINADGTVSIASVLDAVQGIKGIVGLPNYAMRKFAGTVEDANGLPLKREIRVVDKETGRYLASGYSSETTGAFEVIVTSSNPAIVYCVGEGGELTKLEDGIIPIPI